MIDRMRSRSASLFLLDFGPGVTQADGTIEDERLGRAQETLRRRPTRHRPEDDPEQIARPWNRRDPGPPILVRVPSAGSQAPRA